MKRILLAIGEPNYSKILRDRFKPYPEEFAVLEQEVLHHKYLIEILEQEQPEILIVHDYYLQTEKVTDGDKEIEWLNFIETIRTQFDDSIRVVFLCERNKGDVFLSELVSRNVLDIFNSNSINVHDLIEQLMEKARYSNVAKFKVGTTYTIPLSSEDVQTPIEPEVNEPERKVKRKEEKERPVKPTVTKVVEKKIIEKKVVNKIVNKQVVKREFKFNVTNTIDRVIGVPIERKLVLIGSPFTRTGSTFVSHLLAGVLSDLGIDTTYIESPYSPAYTYDRFVGHEKVKDYASKYYKYTKYASVTDESNSEFKINNVHLVAKHPTIEPIYDEHEVGFDTFVKVLLTSLTPVTIVDVGAHWNKEVVQELYDIADQVYMVLEPDISNLQVLEESLDKTTMFYRKALKDDKTAIIGNRFDDSILKNKVIRNLFNEKIVTTVPAFTAKDTFNSQYQGTFIHEQAACRQMVQEAMMPLFKELLPDEFIKKHFKKKGLFKGMLNKKFHIEQS